MRTLLPALLVASLVVGGCHVGRHAIPSPGTSQALHAESGDRFFMDLEEDAAGGCRWSGTSNDPDVDVVIDHVPGEGLPGTPGKAEVTIRVHRGYDGPSVVTFVYRRRREGTPIKKFTVSLFRRTGDRAFWE